MNKKCGVLFSLEQPLELNGLKRVHKVALILLAVLCYLYVSSLSQSTFPSDD